MFLKFADKKSVVCFLFYSERVHDAGSIFKKNISNGRPLLYKIKKKQLQVIKETPLSSRENAYNLCENSQTSALYGFCDFKCANQTAPMF